ncbi:MAG: glycosyltransferase family 2 protein [Flavobacteriales bacterium]|jgi:glycosyltransferase involved in cell wall biosynthesis|nr:glycosyltransferase family 2 protein [Flavobacteriales bacterium]
MKLSVVIPVFNKAPWLRECVDSVLGQSFPDFELIAVDDRSADDSLAILRSYSDPRMRIIALDRNLGPAGAAQRGHDAATGEYIVRADADDVLHRDRLQQQVRFMDTNQRVGASGTWMELLHEPGVLRRSPLHDHQCRAESLFRIPIFQPTAIYRRSTLLENSIRYEDDWPRYGEDWLFQLRLLTATRLENLPVPLVRYRLGEQNASAAHDPFSGLRRVFRAVLGFHGLPYGEEELRWHLPSAGAFPEPLRAGDIGALRRYLRTLELQAKEQRISTSEAIDLAFRKAWDDLGYQMPRFGTAAVMAYLLRDHQPSSAKWRYLFSSVLKGKRYEPPTERIR